MKVNVNDIKSPTRMLLHPDMQEFLRSGGYLLPLKDRKILKRMGLGDLLRKPKRGK